MMRSAISSISSMRCEMKITLTPGRQTPQDREQRLARRDVERRRRLVEDRHPRSSAQRPRDAARLAIADRQLLDRACSGGTGPRAARQRPPARLDLLARGMRAPPPAVVAEPHVVKNRARRRDEDLLEDGERARPRATRGVSRAQIGTPSTSSGRRSAMDAGQQLDQCGLADPFSPMIAWTSPRRDIQRAVAKCARRPERLGDQRDAQQRLSRPLPGGSGRACGLSRQSHVLPWRCPGAAPLVEQRGEVVLGQPWASNDGCGADARARRVEGTGSSA